MLVPATITLPGGCSYEALLDTDDPDYGLDLPPMPWLGDEEDESDEDTGTTVTVTEGYSPPPFPFA